MFSYTLYYVNECIRLRPIKQYNFQQWISWFSHRWRTQRIAICNVNCRIQWIIESLNAPCALWYSEGHACLSVIKFSTSKFCFEAWMLEGFAGIILIMSAPLKCISRTCTFGSGLIILSMPLLRNKRSWLLTVFGLSRKRHNYLLDLKSGRTTRWT